MKDTITDDVDVNEKVLMEELKAELLDGFKLEKIDNDLLELTHDGEQVTCFKELPSVRKLAEIMNYCS